jgi:hypothetical protein
MKFKLKPVALCALRSTVARASILGALCITAGGNANALGIVSRSCLLAGAQESISVDWSFTPYLLWTASTHFYNGAFLHTINTVASAPDSGGWEYTWRSYAGHLLTEFWYGEVIGDHWRNDYGLYSYLGQSFAYDCNLANWGGG